MALSKWRRSVLMIVALPLVIANSNLYTAPVTETDSMETYLFEDKEYIVSAGRINWQDAQFICQSYNGTLAILDTPSKADFLAEALSESGLILEDVWIGAKRESPEDPGGYRWISGDKSEISRTDADVWDFANTIDLHAPPNHYPYWINRTGVAVPDEGSNCVAFERGFHDVPVFVDLHCKLNRGYACEKPKTQNRLRDLITEKNSVRCERSEYQVFNARVTFEEAAGFCALHGMQIAAVESMKCLEKIARRMLKARPTIENAWIGARGTAGQWKWSESGKPVDEKPEGYIPTDPLEKAWPPFRPFMPRKQDGCLLLDRHVCDHAVFLEARCERKRDFICTKSVKSGISRDSGLAETGIPPSDEKYYYNLVYDRMTWPQAEANCESMNGSLATVLSEDVMTQLLIIMGENVDESVHHVWVNGKLRITKNPNSLNHTYQWFEEVSNLTIPRAFDPEQKGYYPPWCDDEMNKDYACLNLDRENHMTPLIYGMPCQTMQYSICMIEKGKFFIPVKTAVINPSAQVDQSGAPGALVSQDGVPGIGAENPGAPQYQNPQLSGVSGGATLPGVVLEAPQFNQGVGLPPQNLI